MCKPKICKTISWVNQNEPNVNFLPPYANHKILVIPKSFTKSLRVTAYFYGLITCPTFLVQSVEVTFWGEKKVYMVYTGLHRFTSVCPPMRTRTLKLWIGGGRCLPARPFNRRPSPRKTLSLIHI